MDNRASTWVRVRVRVTCRWIHNPRCSPGCTTLVLNPTPTSICIFECQGDRDRGDPCWYNCALLSTRGSLDQCTDQTVICQSLYKSLYSILTLPRLKCLISMAGSSMSTLTLQVMQRSRTSAVLRLGFWLLSTLFLFIVITESCQSFLTPMYSNKTINANKVRAGGIAMARGISLPVHRRSLFSTEYPQKRNEIRHVSACLRPWPFPFYIRPSILNLLSPVTACAFYTQLQFVCKSNRLARLWQRFNR